MIKIFLIFSILISFEWLILAYLPDNNAKEAEEALLKVSDHEMQRYKKRISDGQAAVDTLINIDCSDLILEVHGEEPVDIQSFERTKKWVYFQLIEDKFQKMRQVPVLECKSEIGLFSFTAGPHETNIYLEKAASESGVVEYYPSKKVTYDFEKWYSLEIISNVAKKIEICRNIIWAHKQRDYIVMRAVRGIRRRFGSSETKWTDYGTLRCYYTDSDFFEYAPKNSVAVYVVEPRGLEFKLGAIIEVDYLNYNYII